MAGIGYCSGNYYEVLLMKFAVRFLIAILIAKAFCLKINSNVSTNINSPNTTNYYTTNNYYCSYESDNQIDASDIGKSKEIKTSYVKINSNVSTNINSPVAINHSTTNNYHVYGCESGDQIDASEIRQPKKIEPGPSG